MSSVEYKKDLQVIKQLHNPPQSVKDTTQVMCLLLGYSEQEAKDWRFVRKLLQSNDLPGRLRNHDVKTCSPENLKKAKEIHDNVPIDVLRRCCFSAGCLHDWNSTMISSS